MEKNAVQLRNESVPAAVAVIDSGSESSMTPSLLLQSIVKGGITPENVAVFEKAMEICFRMESRDAEKQFNQAFVKLQSELPVIVAESVIPNRGKYQRFEDLMRDIATPLQRNGFSVSFSMESKESRVLETCKLSHIGGHSQSNSFSVRPGKGDSDAQADCKAATIAKRNALCNALNIVIRQDCLNEESDASLEGGFITPEQADELERRVSETSSDKAKFLSVASASCYKEIRSGKYEVLDAMLRKKESQGR